MDLWVPPDLITDEIKGYWESYQIFKNEMIDRTIFVEKEIYCDCYQYIGHLDWAGILIRETSVTVLDWKSPVTEGNTWRAQVAAYWHLVDKHSDLPPGCKVKRCGALMLSPKGKAPKMKEYTEFKVRFFNDFLKALDAHRTFCP